MGDIFVGYYYITASTGPLMILIKGWKPISVLRATVYVHWIDKRPEGRLVDTLPPDNRTATINASLEQVARKLTKLKIALADSQVVDADPGLLHGTWVGAMSHDVDLYVGSIGSGWFLSQITEKEPWIQDRELRLRYGPFLGCPVFINQREASRALKEVFPNYAGTLAASDQVADTLSDTIAQALAKNPPGPPKMYGGLIERMVQRHYGPRIVEGGDLSSKSKTWTINDARAWIETLTGEDIHESTMKSWIMPLYGKPKRTRPRRGSN